MAHPQNSPRGLFAKKRIDVSASGEVHFQDYSTTNALLTANSTGMKVRGGVALSNQSNFITQNSTAITIPAGIKISNKANAQLTGNSTGVVVPGKVKLSNQKYLGANSTCYLPDSTTALPSVRQGVANLIFIRNSTGVNAVGINTTGTTWKYLSVTTTVPT